jgi:hypothetical protein
MTRQTRAPLPGPTLVGGPSKATARRASLSQRGGYMRRRIFIAGLGAAAWPVVGRGQATLPVIGYLNARSGPAEASLRELISRAHFERLFGSR